MMCSTLFYRNLIKDDFKLIRSSSKLGSKLIKTCYLLDKIALFVQLLACLFDSNCNMSWKQPAVVIPWGCYPHQIIDAERVCKPRFKEDCSTSVAHCAIRCVAPSIKRSAEAFRVRSMRHIISVRQWALRRIEMIKSLIKPSFYPAKSLRRTHHIQFSWKHYIAFWCFRKWCGRRVCRKVAVCIFRDNSALFCNKTLIFVELCDMINMYYSI